MKHLTFLLVPTPPRRNPDEPDRNGKSPEEIGIFTIYLILISLSVLFIGGMIAYLWMKHSVEQGYKSTWAFQKIYDLHILFLPTSLTLLVSLYFLKATISSVKRNFFLKVSRNLKLLLTFGVLFVLEELGFVFYFKEMFFHFEKNIFLFIFLLLSFLHNFHFIIGMFFLSFFVYKAEQNKYTSKSYSDIKYLSIYWNYLVWVWVIIYLFLSLA